MGKIFSLALAILINMRALAADKVEDWRALTTTDLAAAAEMIRENHPAMTAELGDQVFIDRFNHQLSVAEQRAKQVVNAAGMTGVMKGFAAGLGDEHIYWSADLPETPMFWPGFLVYLHQQKWQVLTTNTEGPVNGAILTGCDNETTEQLMARRLQFRVSDPEVITQYLRYGHRLLLDDGNPFNPRPVKCHFSHQGKTLSHRLHWQPLDPEQRKAIFSTLPKRMAEAGYGIEPLADGWWIRLGGMTKEAEQVINQAQSLSAKLATAPYVLVDVRGNGGGSSYFGERLVQLLSATDSSVEKTSHLPEGCDSVWRVSKNNLATLLYYAEKFPFYREQALSLASKMQLAVTQNKAFTRDVSDCQQASAKSSQSKVQFKQKVVILTDTSCFSSCLLMVELFRQHGAVQVGLPTNAVTRYMEVKETLLPSGIARFSTLQAVGFHLPLRYGPFLPNIPLNVDISDEAGIKKWFLGWALQQ